MDYLKHGLFWIILDYLKHGLFLASSLCCLAGANRFLSDSIFLWFGNPPRNPILALRQKMPDISDSWQSFTFIICITFSITSGVIRKMLYKLLQVFGNFSFISLVPKEIPIPRDDGFLGIRLLNYEWILFSWPWDFSVVWFSICIARPAISQSVINERYPKQRLGKSVQRKGQWSLLRIQPFSSISLTSRLNPEERSIVYLP